MAGEVFAAAFLAAQSEFPEIPKDATGKIQGVSKGSGKAYNFEYKYASLPAILRAVLPVLHKHKLSILQPLEKGEIITTLLHASGDGLNANLECSPEGLTPQEFGAKVTYYRRYALVSMLGIAPDEDIDGSGIDTPEVTKPPKQKAPPRSPNPSPIERLLTDDKDLVKAWSPSIRTQADAERVVADLLDVLRGEATEGDDHDLYVIARRHMNAEIDKRAAG